MIVRRTHLLLALLLIATPVAQAAAAQKAASDRFNRELPLSVDGSFRIDNPIGNISVVAGEAPSVSLVVERVVRGADDDAINEGRRATQLRILSDGRNIVLQSLMPFSGNGRWTAAFHYTVRVPRSVRVQINSGLADTIQVRGLTGALLLKNTDADITVIATNTAMDVETSNGNIRYIGTERPKSNIRLVSINGTIEVSVPKESPFEWVAETLRGGIFSSFDLHGGFDKNPAAKIYRALVNGGGPRIETFSGTGRVYLIARGTAREAAAELNPGAQASAPVPVDRQVIARARLSLLRPTSASNFVFQRELFDGDVAFATSLGNIVVGEVRGDATMSTRTGEIILGQVAGNAQVHSWGGPINLGDVGGLVDARTEAGDVSIRSARKGGYVSTTGGEVLVGSNDGEMTIVSGGGDVTVRRAGGPLDITTRSGDVTVNIAGTVKSQKVTARTTAGKITVTLPAGLAADIDATIITSSPDAHSLDSNLAGLTVSNEKLSGGRSRIHAVGKVNGGGQRIELHNDEGDIAIHTRVAPPAH